MLAVGTGSEARQDLVLYDAGQALQLIIVPHAVANVTEGARDVCQVTRFAITIVEPRKNPDGFEMPLDAHQMEPLLELLQRGSDIHPHSPRLTPIVMHPSPYAGSGPANVAVL